MRLRREVIIYVRTSWVWDLTIRSLSSARAGDDRNCGRDNYYSDHRQQSADPVHANRAISLWRIEYEAVPSGIAGRAAPGNEQAQAEQKCCADSDHERS